MPKELVRDFLKSIEDINCEVIKQVEINSDLTEIWTYCETELDNERILSIIREMDEAR